MTGGVHDVKLPSRQSVVTLRHNEAEGEVKYSHTTVSEHNNRKHYCCDTCDYKTVKESHMRQHVNVHARCREAEKYYRCSHCKYEALYQFSITRHSEKFHPNEVAGVILVSSVQSGGGGCIFSVHFSVLLVDSYLFHTCLGTAIAYLR